MTNLDIFPMFLLWRYIYIALKNVYYLGVVLMVTHGETESFSLKFARFQEKNNAHFFISKIENIS